MDKTPEKEPDHVFEDRSGLRGRLAVVSLVALGLLLVVWWWDFAHRLMFDAPTTEIGAVPSFAGKPAPAGKRPQDALITLQTDYSQPCARDPADLWQRQRLVLGYVPAADDTALSGLGSRCDQLDRVMIESFLLGAPDGTVVPLWAKGNLALQDLADTLGLPGRLPLHVARITASTRTGELAALLSPGPAMDKLASQLAGYLSGQDRPSLCLDLGAHPDLDPPVLRVALGRIRDDASVIAAAPVALCLIAGPEAGFWRDPALVEMLDLAVVKGFREDASPLVAPADPDWFARSMSQVRAAIPGPKLAVALGSFGLSWQSGQSRAEQLGFAETLARADRAGATPVFDAEAGAFRLRFLGADRHVNDLWLLEGGAFHNQLALLDPQQTVVVWPLGYEDPTIWPLLQADPLGIPMPFGLTRGIDLSSQVLIETGGPILGAVDRFQFGQRWVRLDDSGRQVVDMGFESLPLPNRVQRHGGGQAGSLILAFDGLPGSTDVGPVIASLAEHRVQASFFVTLSGLLQRRGSALALAAAGHVLGLRLAPPLPDRPESLLAARMRLNAAQLYLTRVFKAPAHMVMLRPGSGQPSYSRNAFLAEAELLQRGLILIQSAFDAPLDPFDSQEFVDRILREGDARQTQVITLDLREASAAVTAALPGLLTRLKGDGFGFVMPQAVALSGDLSPVQLPEGRATDALAFPVVGFFLYGLATVFFVMLVISAVFSVIYIVLSLVRRPGVAIDPDFTPPVSVVIPAFNEEKVIAACLASVLRSDYPDLRVYVVDDGSTDRTAEMVARTAAGDPRVQLLQEENAGKWHAANLAIGHIDTPILVAADADSIFLPDTIRWLVQPFKDEEVGAVAGLVEVGNRVNLLSDFQHQEYMVTQNVLRRAHEFFDGILVVPGAVGAWRTRAVREGGGFSGETITEDADLTVAVHRAGYRVRFQENARSITEAPVSIRAFLRQRLRWQLGMLQVSWKHRKVITSGLPVGFSVVDSIWFGPVSLMLAILDDLLLLTVMGTFLYATVLQEPIPGGELPVLIFTSYLIMTGVEALRTLTAFWLEGRFELKTLLLIPLLRFGYRQLLYVTALRGLFRALAGHPTGWYKLDRTGTRLRAASGE